MELRALGRRHHRPIRAGVGPPGPGRSEGAGAAYADVRVSRHWFEAVSTQGTMTGPTRDQEERLEVTRTRFDQGRRRVGSGGAEVILRLNELLREHGIREVEVPARGRTEVVRLAA